MSRLVRVLTLSVIALLPFNLVRKFFYRLFFGYRFGKKARIGWLSFVDAKKVTFNDYACLRGLFNVFMNIGELKVGRHARIGSPRAGFNLAVGYGKGRLIVGDGTHIELFHYFDVSDDIIFKENVVLGGIRSVIFTHTLYKEETAPVVIGRDSFIGSNVSFCQGTEIGENCVVAMGSVITKKFTANNALISGNPANVVKENFGYNAEKAFKLRNIEYINVNKNEK